MSLSAEFIRARAPLGMLALLLVATPARAQILQDLRDRTELRLGGDVGLRKFTGGASEPFTFALGQFDAFLYVQLTPSVAVLTETVLEAGDDNEVGIDLERAELIWAPARWFKITAGRSHTPLGYWNITYHHASWLQTTIDRPVLDRYEDEGGPLPLHTIGVHLSGLVPLSDALRLGYDLGVANNRGATPDPPVNLKDNRDGKAFYGGLHLLAGGLRFGAAGYYDEILPASLPGSLLKQVIFVADASFIGERLEVIAEYGYFHDATPGVVAENHDGYLQVSYGLGMFRPYARVEKVRISPDEVYLNTPDQLEAFGGLRFDVNDYVALKAEAGFIRENGVDGAFGKLQLSWFY